jgi:peptide/nickel transport system substrate-binding protein
MAMEHNKVGMDLTRRTLTKGLALSTLIPAARAAEADTVTIGWPVDVPSWDPNQHYMPDAQSIFKMVFDQPLMQARDLTLIPQLFKSWTMAKDSTSLAFEIQDGVTFHNGDKLTTDDVQFTFGERTKDKTLDIRTAWTRLADIEVQSPTKGVMHFSSPDATALPWLAFLGQYVVPKAYMQSVGQAGFIKAPVGTGPYKLVEYATNARIVLERNEQYWGPKPAIRRVIVEVIKDPSARVAAVESGQVDITIAIPVREAVRLKKSDTLVSVLNPITRVILMQFRNDMAFADSNVRLAMAHAIDKDALSKAFFGGAARPLSVVATPGTPGYVPDYQFKYDPALSLELLKKSGFSPQNPVKVGFATTNGAFAGDYDIARAIVQMCGKVGITLDLQVIELAQYFALNKAGKLPEATIYSWDNAVGDPETYSGYLLNPKMPFSAWKGAEVGDKIQALFNEGDNDKRLEGYRKVEVEASETGATMALLQTIQTLARRKTLKFETYDNGWVLPQTMSWS